MLVQSSHSEFKACSNNILITQSQKDKGDRMVEKKPNIIFLLVDGLRPDRLGCYGYKRGTSPNIDKFSEKTVFFENTITQGNYTIPAVGSILTGLFPFSHGATPKTKMSPKIKTWAQRMNNLDYKTCAFVGGAYFSKEFGFDTGFDEFHQDKESCGLARKQRLFDNQKELFKWLDENKDENFFLFLHGFDVHVPFEPPKEFAEKFCSTEKVEIDTNLLNLMAVQLREKKITEKQVKRASDLYDAEINYFDNRLGGLFDEIKRLGLWDNSYIIVTSDHGIAFMEHGEISYGGFNFYDELLKVPLMIKRPGEHEGKKIKALARHIDIMPTILDLEGVKFGDEIAGESLKETFEKGFNESSADSYYENSSKSRFIRAYRNSKWKIIEKKMHTSKAIRRISPKTFFAYLKNFFKVMKSAELRSQLGGKIELYNISVDPEEKENLAGKNPEKLAELMEKMDSFKERHVKFKSESAELSPETQQKLKTLGYL